MDLYIARHGEAGAAMQDNLRELTAHGVAVTRAVYTRCAARIHQPIGTIISSPLIRARQTAVIAEELLPVTATQIHICEELRPESTPRAIGGLLDSQLHWPVLVVGHQPVLGNLLYWLTDQEHFRSGIATSTLYALNLISPARGCGTVLWNS